MNLRAFLGTPRRRRRRRPSHSRLCSAVGSFDRHLHFAFGTAIVSVIVILIFRYCFLPFGSTSPIRAASPILGRSSISCSRRPRRSPIKGRPLIVVQQATLFRSIKIHSSYLMFIRSCVMLDDNGQAELAKWIADDLMINWRNAALRRRGAGSMPSGECSIQV